MINVRKQVDVKAALSEVSCEKYLSSPLLDYFEAINDEFVLFKLKKAKLLLNKPIYIGFTVLELSKLHMYEIYYDHLKKIFNDRVRLLYTDTDSLYLQIDSNDVYSDLKIHFSKILDTSNYPSDHVLYSEHNKSKLGCLKNESVQPIESFIGLKSKMYSYHVRTSENNNIEKIKAKGIKIKNDKNITFDLFKKVLFGNTYLRHRQHSIISKRHSLFTISNSKIGLSSFYDKKFLIDPIQSNAYGHRDNCEFE